MNTNQGKATKIKQQSKAKTVKKEKKKLYSNTNGIQSSGSSDFKKRKIKYVNRSKNCSFLLMKKKSQHLGFIYKFGEGGFIAVIP